MCQTFPDSEDVEPTAEQPVDTPVDAPAITAPVTPPTVTEVAETPATTQVSTTPNLFIQGGGGCNMSSQNTNSSGSLILATLVGTIAVFRFRKFI